MTPFLFPLDTLVTLNQDDMTWGMVFKPSICATKIIPPCQETPFFDDASKAGCGAHLNLDSGVK